MTAQEKTAIARTYADAAVEEVRATETFHANDSDENFVRVLQAQRAAKNARAVYNEYVAA